MNKRLALYIALFCSLAVSSGQPINAAENQPNLIVIMTDEHNFRTIGAYRKLMDKDQAQMWGPEVVDTPNIDWLADNGAIATSFYAAAPVCTPSRGAFVTGQYPQNNQAVQNNIPLKDDAITFAQVLKEQGYATGYVGKWHLDGSGKPQWAPERKFGFDDNTYMYNRGHWKQFEDTDNGPRVIPVNSKGNPISSSAGATAETFTTDFKFNKVMDFVSKHNSKPFAIMLSLADPHGPDTVRAPYDTMYDHIDFKLPHTMSVKAEDAPLWAKPESTSNNMSNYYGMVKLIDDKMKDLYYKLDELKIRENTIIVFTSDHGDLKGEHGRQNKGNPFEGSARIPFIVYYPEKIKANTVVRQALTTVDFQPTILSLMAKPLSGQEDGRDASKLFTQPEQCRDWLDIAYMRQSSKTGEGWLTAISDRYKLVFDPIEQPWLLDLEKDPDELINFYNDPSYNNVIKKMAKGIQDYANQYQDPFVNQQQMQQQITHAIGGQ